MGRNLGPMLAVTRSRCLVAFSFQPDEFSCDAAMLCVWLVDLFLRRIMDVLKRIVGLGIVGIVLLVAVAQVVPYGRGHTNPPVSAEPKWDSIQTRDLAVRACFDCHSNATVWPWYSNVAPMSWLVQHDVEEGRGQLNFSAWDKPQREARGASREVQRGKMPPSYYVPLHPAAGLSAADRDALVQGLQKTVAAGAPPGGGESEREGERD